MNYHEAARTRKTGLSALIVNNLMSGGSIKGAISDRMQASMVGLKEKFDPLNIASKLTGGSKIGPALLGRMTGRSKEDIDYFANRKRIHRFDNVMNQGHGSGDSRKATEILENIYSFMVKTRESQIKDNHSSIKFENERQQANQRRHDEVMNVFNEATKRNRRAVAVIAKPKPAEKTPEAQPPTPPKPGVSPKPEPAKPTPAPAKPVEPVKAPEPAKPTPAPAKPVEPVKPVEPAKPTPAPAKPVEPVKAPEPVKPTPAPAKPVEPVKAPEVVKPPPEVVKPPVKPVETAKPVPKPESAPPSAAPAPPPVTKPPTAAPVKPPTVSKPTVEKVPTELGKLSSQFETGGRKNAAAIVGYDSTGGTSYGTYQIAAKVGGMAAFLKYAEARGETDIVSRLKSAGPADTGSNKGPFVDEWKKIANEKGSTFEKLQHDFIEKSQYEPSAAKLFKLTKYDVLQQSSAIKDVYFSTVVQHGSGGAVSIFKKAIEDSGGINANPSKIIENVYKIRATKFGSSNESVRKSVQERFIKEQTLAQEMLKKDGDKLASTSVDNVDMKKSLNESSNAQPVVVNNTTNVLNKETTVASSSDRGSDNPQYKRQ